MLQAAIYSTSEHRGTLDTMKEGKKVIEVLKGSDTMKKQWERYQNDNFYAEGIGYDDLIEGIMKVGQAFMM